jgi:transposase
MLTAGNTSDITVADELTSDVVECFVVEDMGYDSDKHRDSLRSQNNIPVIPGRKNRKIPIVYDKIMYRLRGGIERFFGKLKENKRLSQRYDKEDNVFLSFIALASLKILFKILIS